MRHLETLITEGDVLDEKTIEIDGDELDKADEKSIEDVDVEVTALGLKEDTDKCATVTFDLEVEYGLEEGVRHEFEKDMVVVFDVCYEEGDFTDEEVELVSIM